MNNCEYAMKVEKTQSKYVCFVTHNSRWIAYSRKQTEKQLSYKLLLDILHKLNSIWKPTSISRDEVFVFQSSW